LLHTNIVPVFEVGRDGDVAFYTMQFIQGEGLDQVIDELARLRTSDRDPGRHDRDGSEGALKATITIQSAVAATAASRGGKLAQVVESLLIGRLGIGGLASSDGSATATTQDAGTAPFDPTATMGADASDPDPPFPASPPSSVGSGSAVLPGGTAVSSVESSGRRMPYFRSVAQIGRQAAQGLAHARARGIAHRDIKPSNLLLDTAGVVWISDFGLAKAEDDGLTATGDLLGTLRYMAPERFRGEGDHRADLYALGLTLYELLTLRPAFDTSDRLELIERIKSEEPARPRSLDARIPRDLETIVLKASDKDPAQRYATAEAMAEDLRRFLVDEPIQVRRISGAERSWRWCRRNPGLAGASALSVLAMVATAAIATAFGVHQASNAYQQTLAAGRELGLRKSSEVLLARVALKEGVSRCEQSEVAHGLLWLARALEFAPADQPDLQREIRLNIDRWSRSAPHLRDAREFSGRVNAVAISPDGTRALAGSSDGTAQLWEPASGRPIAPALRHGGSVLAVAFSPDGTLAVTAAADWRVRLWKSDTGVEARPPLDHGGPIERVVFSPDGRHLATGGPNRPARLWDLSSGHSIALRRDPESPEPPGETVRWDRPLRSRRNAADHHPHGLEPWAARHVPALGRPDRRPDRTGDDARLDLHLGPDLRSPREADDGRRQRRRRLALGGGDRHQEGRAVPPPGRGHGLRLQPRRPDLRHRLRRWHNLRLGSGDPGSADGDFAPPTALRDRRTCFPQRWSSAALGGQRRRRTALGPRRRSPAGRALPPSRAAQVRRDGFARPLDPHRSRGRRGARLGAADERLAPARDEPRSGRWPSAPTARPS
jgi:hypothetical protein